VKLYESKAWLKREYVTKRKSPEQIAKEQGVSHMTIRRWLKHHKLIFKP